jgi:hypothetical protein
MRACNRHMRVVREGGRSGRGSAARLMGEMRDARERPPECPSASLVREGAERSRCGVRFVT